MEDAKHEVNLGYNQDDDVPMLEGEQETSSALPGQLAAAAQHLIPSPPSQPHPGIQPSCLPSQPPPPYSFPAQSAGYDQPNPPVQPHAPYPGQQMARGYPGQYPGQYPGPGYPPAGGYYSQHPVQQQPQQQQQQHVVVVNAGQPIIEPYVMPYDSFSGHKTLACFVFWCCAWIFGLIAYLLASSAESSQHTDPEGSRRLGRASVGVSIAGIAVGIVVVGVLIGVYYGRP